MTAANSEYRHVQATGAFLNDSETLVQALTDLGAGFWVLTPLRLGDGTVVLVNRGFVPPEQRERAAHGAAEATTAATVTGLLRITEPKGWFLRRNDPAKNHWYSRDVQAIAAARGLDRPGGAVLYRSGGQCCRRCRRGRCRRGGWWRWRHRRSHSAPVGGLTVIAFRNTHLTYAITWYGLAALVVVGAWIVIREERRRRPTRGRPERSGGNPEKRRRRDAGRPPRSSTIRPVARTCDSSSSCAGSRSSGRSSPSPWCTSVFASRCRCTTCRWCCSVSSLSTRRACCAGGTRIEVTNSMLFVSLLVDVTTLTAQLYLSGGTTNPFVFLYLLQVILGAVLLRAWAVWTIVAITGACFAGLTLLYRPLALPPGDYGVLSGPYIQGTLLCFALNAALLVIFITRINRNLRARDARLAYLRERAAEEEHIVRMGLLASGAAHELGTPLSTLSVILGDWRRMPGFASDPERVQEIDEMQAQVTRCKGIVSGILLSAGEARGESPVETTVRTFLDDLVAEWRSTRPVARLTY